jgi:hypothetical protein
LTSLQKELTLNASIDCEISISSSEQEKPKKRGRKAVDLFKFEQDSLKKIAELKDQAKNDTLSPRSKRMFRNKASAQQSRLEKKLALWRLKKTYKSMEKDLLEVARRPKPTLQRIREILSKNCKL